MHLRCFSLSGFATLAAGNQAKDASGGPAGGQTFTRFYKDGFDKQVLKNNLG